MSELNIPESWAETDFKNAILIQGGSQPPKSEFSTTPKKGYIRLIQIRDFRSDDNPVYIPIEKAKRSFTKDDIMIGRYGPPVFQILRGKEGSYNVALMKATPTELLDKEFMYWFLKNPKIYTDVNAVAQRSAGQTGVNLDFLNVYQVPIPPKKEQQRIVQKIESCFEEIESTEKNLQKVEVLLEKYRESLLAKAFRGELIPQDPNDEPASVLLAKIREERDKDPKNKKVEFKPISDDEKPFDIPKGWEWVRLAEIIDVRDGTHDSPKFLKSGVPLVTSKNLRDGKIDFGKINYISDADHQQIKKRSEVSVGDLLIAMIGTLGNPVIVQDSIEFSIKNIALFKHNKYFSDLSFLKMFIESPLFSDVVNDFSKGTTQKFLGLNVLRNIVFPLPPLNELDRIKKRYDLASSNLEKIKSDIEQKIAHIKSLRESILKKAFEGRLVEQIESEGTGHELLAKILTQKEIPEQKKEKKNGRKKK